MYDSETENKDHLKEKNDSHTKKTLQSDGDWTKKSILTEKQIRFVLENMAGQDHSYVGTISKNPEFRTKISKGRDSVLKSRV